MHTRLSTVTFLPRGSIEDAAVPVAQSSEIAETSLSQKVPETLLSVPQLPYCRASKSLFAACSVGDLEVLKALLADINGNHSFVTAVSDTGALDSVGSSSSGDVAVSSVSLTTGASIEGGLPNESESELWDLKDVLNMPESLEDMSTCLHLASERGSIRVCD